MNYKEFKSLWLICVLLYFLFLHLFLFLYRVHTPDLSYHLLFPQSCLYPILLRFRVLNFSIHPLFSYWDMGRRSKSLLGMHRDSQTSVQAIVCWLSLVVKMCWAIATLERESNVRYTAVQFERLGCVFPALKMMVLSYTTTERSNMRRICRTLWVVLMGSVTQAWWVAYCLALSIRLPVFQR